MQGVIADLIDLAKALQDQATPAGAREARLALLDVLRLQEYWAWRRQTDREEILGEIKMPAISAPDGWRRR